MVSCRLYLLASSLVLLAACGGDAQATPTRTPVLTPTPTPVLTVTATPTATPAASPSPTAHAAAESPSPTLTATTPAEGQDQDCGNAIGNGNEIVSGPSGPEPQTDNDSVFRSLTVHPNDPNTILMGTERNGFVKSTDGGITWTRYRDGLRHTQIGYPEIWDIAFSPSDPSIVFAATLDSPGPVTGDAPSSVAGVYKSIDGGETWVRMNCGLTSSRINSIRFDSTDPEIAVLGIEGGVPSYTGDSSYYDGGVYRTTDGGESWSRIPLGTNDNKNGFWRIEARGSNPTTFITFGMNYDDLTQSLGYLKSTDGGESWNSLKSGELTGLRITNFDVSSDGKVMYANTHDSYFIWISTDGGNTWIKSSINQANGPVAVSPMDSDIVIFSAMNSLYRSTDGLRTTSKVVTTSTPPGHFRSPPFHDIVFAPSDPNVVYAATEGYLIYKSTNAGASFTLIKSIRADVFNVDS